VIMHDSCNPIASKKAAGRACSNCNHIGFGEQSVIDYNTVDKF
jgi:hypothetical protein